MQEYISYFWGALIILFLIGEFLTTSIFSIWFSVGSLFSLIISLVFPQAMFVQTLVFISVSGLCVLITRPILAKKFLKRTPTNTDMIIGKTACVVEEITQEKAGRIKIEGTLWRAKSNKSIKQGNMCKIIKIEGASVVVEEVLSDDVVKV